MKEKCLDIDMATGWKDCWNFSCLKDHQWRRKEIYNQPERLNPETPTGDVIVRPTIERR